MDFQIQRAKLSDVPKVHRLITYFADQGEVLHRPLTELYENVRDYFVIKGGEELIACASVHVLWGDLAEIKAVAVREDYQSLGLGKLLLTRCFEEARDLELATVFVLTHKPAYYEQFGFQLVDVNTLPRKVWGECLRCPKFPQCNELAMVYHLKPEGAQSLLADPGEAVPAAALPMWRAAGRFG